MSRPNKEYLYDGHKPHFQGSGLRSKRGQIKSKTCDKKKRETTTLIEQFLQGSSPDRMDDYKGSRV